MKNPSQERALCVQEWQENSGLSVLQGRRENIEGKGQAIFLFVMGSHWILVSSVIN